MGGGGGGKGFSNKGRKSQKEQANKGNLSNNSFEAFKCKEECTCGKNVCAATKQHECPCCHNVLKSVYSKASC